MCHLARAREFVNVWPNFCDLRRFGGSATVALAGSAKSAEALCPKTCQNGAVFSAPKPGHARCTSGVTAFSRIEHRNETLHSQILHL